MNDLILLGVGFVVAFIGTMSGGGAGLLALFTLLAFGLPINQAIATNKFGDLGFFLPALRNFIKAKQINKKALPAIIAINIVGVTVGTLSIALLNVGIFRKLVAVILVIIIITGLIRKSDALKERPPRWYWPFVYFGTSVSSGAVGAGTGILSTLTLLYFRGFTALHAMANSFYASAISSTLSVSILLFTGLIHWQYGLFLFVGNVIGSHLGSKLAIKKGDGFVRIMIILLAIAVVLQLIFAKS
jgi:uncharacterized membrane protein YfcA